MIGKGFVYLELASGRRRLRSIFLGDVVSVAAGAEAKTVGEILEIGMVGVCRV